jgi:hypothetical protein
MINVSAGSHSSAGAQSDMVNETTGVSNIDSINGVAGVTTLHFADLGNSLTLSNFSNKVSGLTTLDVSSGSGTNIVITAQDVINMGLASGATSHLLTVKMSTSESLQIMANGSDHYVYFPGTTDYAFYNASNQEVARIHLVTARGVAWRMTERCAQRSIARSRKRQMPGSAMLATLMRMRVEGSCEGENRLPGASRKPCSMAASVMTLVSRPVSTHRNMPQGGGSVTSMPSVPAGASPCRARR